MKVLQGGFSATIQDADGRPGYYALGIPPSGAADNFSLRVGNILVGNDQNEAGIEVILFGLKLEALSDVTISVTGADLSAKLNNSPCPLWEAAQMKKTDILSFSGAKAGSTAYVSVAGGIDVPLVLGSKSTYVRGRLGGYQGRKLQVGDTLHVGKPKSPATELVGRRLRKELVPQYGKEWEARIIFGVTEYVYTEESRDLFLKSTWKVSSESDRVGYRFIGPKLGFVERKPPFGAGTDPSNVVDIPYPIGSIHCPSGVVPILLHKDGVSGGGYATIGTVITVDLEKVAQSKPGEAMRFREINIEEAMQARLERERLFKTPANLLE